MYPALMHKTVRLSYLVIVLIYPYYLTVDVFLFRELNKYAIKI